MHLSDKHMHPRVRAAIRLHVKRRHWMVKKLFHPQLITLHSHSVTRDGNSSSSCLNRMALSFFTQMNQFLSIMMIGQARQARGYYILIAIRYHKPLAGDKANAVQIYGNLLSERDSVTETVENLPLNYALPFLTPLLPPTTNTNVDPSRSTEASQDPITFCVYVCLAQEEMRNPRFCVRESSIVIVWSARHLLPETHRP